MTHADRLSSLTGQVITDPCTPDISADMKLFVLVPHLAVPPPPYDIFSSGSARVALHFQLKCFSD